MCLWPSLSWQWACSATPVSSRRCINLIVVECGCVNEFISPIVDFAQIPRHSTNISKIPIDSSSPPPLMIFLQSQGKCVASYLKWRRDLSSPPWKLWLWCIHDLGWLSHSSYNTYAYVVCFFPCAQTKAPLCYVELPWENHLLGWAFMLGGT